LQRQRWQRRHSGSGWSHAAASAARAAAAPHHGLPLLLWQQPATASQRLTASPPLPPFPPPGPQVFIVDVRANKGQIRAAVSRMYDIQTQKINTLIR
jgi:hypothetical protein